MSDSSSTLCLPTPSNQAFWLLGNRSAVHQLPKQPSIQEVDVVGIDLPTVLHEHTHTQLFHLGANFAKAQTAAPPRDQFTRGNRQTNHLLGARCKDLRQRPVVIITFPVGVLLGSCLLPTTGHVLTLHLLKSFKINAPPPLEAVLQHGQLLRILLLKSFEGCLQLSHPLEHQ